MAKEMAELIAMLAHSRQEMLAALNGLAQETEIYESWGLKHLLAHIAGWEEACVTSVHAYVQGGGYEIPSYRGIDAYNVLSVDTRAELSYAQVYAEWEMVRQELIAALEAVPAELSLRENGAAVGGNRHPGGSRRHDGGPRTGTRGRRAQAQTRFG